jgi:hypothetical protein
MRYKEDPKNLTVPLELTQIIYCEWETDGGEWENGEICRAGVLYYASRAKFIDEW